VFKQSPPSFRAQYILGRLDQGVAVVNPRDRNVLTTALLYPICTQETLEALFRLSGFLAYGNPETGDPSTRLLPPPKLPRRLFRHLRPRVRHGKPVPWSDEDKPLPFLRYLFDLYNTKHVITGPPKCNAHEGYALTKAVAAGFVPLVKFLLGNRADPGVKGAVAVMAAIQKKDLRMVELLIEGDLDDSGGAKKRRVSDRVDCTRAMMQKATQVGARNIVWYFFTKGVGPDIKTIHSIFSSRK